MTSSSRLSSWEIGSKKEALKEANVDYIVPIVEQIIFKKPIGIRVVVILSIEKDEMVEREREVNNADGLH